MQRSFYDCPQWYDIVHALGTAADATHLEQINNAFGTGGRRWLEPACGTGRFLRILARRGYKTVGYDTSPAMLEYAAARLDACGRRAELVRADMATFTRPGAFDFAFNLINTFRHLLEPLDALNHLNAVARSLRPGGVYLMGIDLADYDDPEQGEQVWTARRGQCKVRHLMFNIPPEPRARLERIVNRLIVDKPSGRECFESQYDLRAYDLAEWLDLMEQSDLRCVASFDFDWQAIALSGFTRDVNLVLKRKRDAPARSPRRQSMAPPNPPHARLLRRVARLEHGELPAKARPAEL